MASSMTKMTLERIAAKQLQSIEVEEKMESELDTQESISTVEATNSDQVLENSVISTENLEEINTQNKPKKQKKKPQIKKSNNIETSSKKKLTEKRSK